MIATSFDYAALPKVAVAACPVCGTANPSTPALDRMGFPIGVSACACSLLYLNPRLSAEAYQAFYRETYRALLWQQYGERCVEPADHTRERGRMIGALLRYDGATAGTLLDVGGGTGALAQGLRDSLPGATITILDPNEDELRQARAIGFATIPGVLEARPLIETPFDLLVCARTADHWLEPLAALRALRASLAPHGRFYLDIVDARRWRARQPLHAFKIDHPLYWTPTSLRRALALTGWAIRRSYNDSVNRLRWSVICEGVN